MDDVAPARIVTRVADMIADVPADAVQMPCADCAQPVWFTPGQEAPAGMENAVLICTRCIMTDPDFRRTADPALMWQLHRSHYWADRLSH